MAVEVRPARAGDAEAIAALVRGERLNPTGLDWRRFHVACEDGAILGAVQVRPHGPELSSLVVRRDRRREGIGGRLVESRLSGEAGPVFIVTPRALTDFYLRYGFIPCGPREAPGHVTLNLVLGQVLGGIAALLRGRRPRRTRLMMRP